MRVYLNTELNEVSNPVDAFITLDADEQWVYIWGEEECIHCGKITSYESTLKFDDILKLACEVIGLFMKGERWLTLC